MTTQGSTFNQFAPSNFQSQMFGQQVSPVSQLPNQIYGGILDEEPRIPFFGALQRANLPSNQRAFYGYWMKSPGYPSSGRCNGPTCPPTRGLSTRASSATYSSSTRASLTSTYGPGWNPTCASLTLWGTTTSPAPSGTCPSARGRVSRGRLTSLPPLCS